MSAAKAISDHLRDWLRGTPIEGTWGFHGRPFFGLRLPAIPEDLFFSCRLPVQTGSGAWWWIGTLKPREGIEKTVKELMAEDLKHFHSLNPPR